jgi:hypothetical protein
MGILVGYFEADESNSSSMFLTPTTEIEVADITKGIGNKNLWP